MIRFVSTFLALVLPIPVFSGPAGGLRPDVIADLAPHPASSKSYNEFWTYQIQFTNGTQLQLNFSRINFDGFKDPVCGSDLAVMGFKGRNYFVAREYPLKNFVFDPVKARLSVHENIFFQGKPPAEHRLFFSTAKKNQTFLLDLNFTEMSAGAVWGDGIFNLRGGKAGLFFHIPKSKVRGRFAVNGDTLAVEGFAWLDHTYLTEFATKVMDVGYRYVLSAGRVEGGYFIQNKDGVSGYGIREENEHLTLLHPSDLKSIDRSSWGGYSMPKALGFSFTDASPTQISRKEDRQCISAFHELNWFEKKGAKFFLGGEIVGLRGLGQTQDSLPALLSFTLIRH